MHENITAFHAVLRTAYSLCLSHMVSHKRECAARRTAHFSLPYTIFHKTGQRMCGSKNHTCSASPILCPTSQEREHAVRRTTCSLPPEYCSPQNRTENVRFFEPHILCLYNVSCKTGQRTCGSKNHTFSSCRALSPIKQYRECVVQRTTHSLPLAH